MHLTATRFAPLTIQVEELEPQCDAIYSVASTDPPRSPSNPRRVLFAQPIVASTHMFSRAAPHKKADLFYTGSEIKVFKLRGRLQGGAALQNGVEWQQAQARTQRPPGPTRIPI